MQSPCVRGVLEFVPPLARVAASSAPPVLARPLLETRACPGVQAKPTNWEFTATATVAPAGISARNASTSSAVEKVR